MEWSRTAFISRWLGRRTSSWLAQKCSTSEKSDRTARSRSTSADLSLKGSGRWKVYTTRKSTRPRQRPRQSGCFWRWQRSRTDSCAISTRSRNFFKADIDKEICIEIPEEFQEFPGAVERLNKAIYRLVQAGRCWNNKFCDDMTAIGF